MKPITREEMYLAAAAGYAVTPPEPVTREEKFLAKLAGMEVETPAVFTRQERFLEEAAVALSRNVIEPLEVTENGTYTAPDGVDGYSPVVVNVATASADLKYVTFMSYDGTVEYGKKAVAVGDDCADPIARGVFAKPTRESDVQYNYTFYGWATEPNGGADANALKAVTEDKTVYANFTSAVRYYTITYYDSDGTTVLRTESLAYGAMPSYTPLKEDHVLSGWTPALATVTGNASYTAVWIEKPSFASSSWTIIKEICKSGKASEYFSIGDKKPITLNYADGTSETINFTIVDMNVHENSLWQICPLTIMADNVVKKSLQPASSASGSKNYFVGNNNVPAYFAELLSAFPSDLQSVMQTVATYNSGYPSKLFIATATQVYGSCPVAGSYNSYDANKRPNHRFPYFASGASTLRTKVLDSSADDYWLDSTYNYVSSSYSYHYMDGTTIKQNMANSYTHGIVPCFCI